MKVVAYPDPDGFVRFACPNPACGRKMRLRGTGGRVTCPDEFCRLRFEVVNAAAVAAEPSPPPTFAPPPPLPTRRRPAPPSRRWLIAGVTGGAALLVALAVGLAVALGGRPVDEAKGPPTPTPPTPEVKRPAEEVIPPDEKKPHEEKRHPEEKKPAEEKKPTPPAPPAAVRPALEAGLKLRGSLAPEAVTQSFGLNTERSHKWVARLRLVNETASDVTLGPDLFLIELSKDRGVYEGFATFGVDSPPVGPSSYGLAHNYESGGRRVNIGGGRYTVGFYGFSGESHGTAPAGGSWSLDRDFPEHSWLIDPPEVLFVPPELRVKSTDGDKRFRLVARFKSGLFGWTPHEQTLVPMEKDALAKMLADDTAHAATRVLAANWLAERCPADAPPLLAAAVSGVNQGQLLASCLRLSAELRGKGLEDKAAKLLADAAAPNGVRSLAAEYLGAVRHAPALDALVAATKDADPAVAAGAVAGLGRFGGETAVKTLTGLLASGRDEAKRNAAFALARCEGEAALRALSDAVGGKDNAALSALSASGRADAFGLFETLAAKETDAVRRESVAHGLRRSNPVKAVGVLLKMIESAPTPKDDYSRDGASAAMAELNRPESVAPLAALAAKGKVAAVHALDRMKHPATEAPLAELATSAPPAVRRFAVEALAARWASKSADTFAAAAADKDARVARAGVRGLRAAKSPRLVELALPLLESRDAETRRAACDALYDAKAGDKAADVAVILFRSADPGVVSTCSALLVAAKWKDDASRPKLGRLLRSAKEYERTGVIRLMRSASGDAMGPKDDAEYYKDAKGWYEKWLAWADGK